MEKFLNSIYAKLLRIILPALAMVMGGIKGSYNKIAQVGENEFVEVPDSHYYAFAGNGLIDWAPLVCMLLCAAAVITAIVCMKNENENTLTALAAMLCIGLVINMLIMCFMPVTLPACGICLVLAVAMVITAMQEMRMEDAAKK